jgi:accessory colonization factor AcfC
MDEMNEMNEMNPVKIYCAGGIAPPLIEVAALFEQKRGIPVKVFAGKAEELIREAKAEKDADILSVGAEHVMDIAEFDNMISKASRMTIGYRRSVLLVQKGNPKRIVGLPDITKGGVTISISISGCLMGVWDDITAQAGITDAVRRNITALADGCGHLIRTINFKEVDVAFGWNVFAVMNPTTIQSVELPREMQVRRSTTAGMFTFSKRQEEAEAFLAFLRTEEARAVYRKYGWEF